MGGFFAFVVAIVAIGCGTGIIIELLKTWGQRGKGLGKTGEAILDEIRALRKEVEEMRRGTHDVILTFDTTVARMDQRVGHLEKRVQPVLPPPVVEEEVQLLGRRG